MHTQKFDPKKLAKLNNPERLNRENPELIWKTLNISSPEVVIDIGAGTGFFAIPFSRKMPWGKVYACDISDEMLQWMHDNLPQDCRQSVIPLKMAESSVPLPDGQADLVLMVNLHHELEAPSSLLHEIMRLLKPGGKVAVIDWKDEETPDGPPVAIRVSEASIREQLQQTGFSDIQAHHNLPFHHFLSAEKPR